MRARWLPLVAALGLGLAVAPALAAGPPATALLAQFDSSPPTLANLSLARSFNATGRRAGVTFELTVSELATIDGTLLKRPLHGKKARFKQFGTLRFVVRIAGDNRFRFTKTAEGSRLQRGSYRLKLVAIDGADNRSKARTVSFTVR
jgi:hypothetical protein